MLYALERESDLGSTSAVLPCELSALVLQNKRWLLYDLLFRTSAANPTRGGSRPEALRSPYIGPAIISLPQKACVSDVENGFDDPQWGSGNKPDAKRKTASLLSVWREAARPVLHIQHLSSGERSPAGFLNRSTESRYVSIGSGLAQP